MHLAVDKNKMPKIKTWLARPSRQADEQEQEQGLCYSHDHSWQRRIGGRGASGHETTRLGGKIAGLSPL